MSTVRSFFRSFSGGLVTPEFWGQIGDAKFQTGLAECRNFIVQPHGPISNRPGTQFVRATKLSSSGLSVRLIPFEFSADQTLVLEFGAGYVRFHTEGATLEASPGVAYEIVTPYQQDDLMDLHHVQSADVLTIVHPNYPPKELRRYGALDWRLVDVAFGPALPAPATTTATATTATSPSNTRDYVYRVTALTAGGDESFAGPSATCVNNLDQTGAFNVITFAQVPGAARYNVYLQDNGLFGLIGSTDGLAFRDDSIAPDLARTPPSADNPFTPPGAILSVPVTAGGSNYSTIIDGGKITAVSVSNKGEFPSTSTVTATVTDPTGTGAVLSVQTERKGSSLLSGGGNRRVARIVVVSPGSGYTNPTVVITVTGGFVTQPVAVATTEAARPRQVGLTVTEASGTGAELTATVVGGAITAINVVKGGQGYTSPTVTISDAAGGSGATLGAPVVGTEGDYPGATAYFEQRRLFAGTLRKPQSFWATRTGTEANLNASIPPIASDALAFRIAARQVNRILHIVPLTSLMLLTGSTEFRVDSAGGALSPADPPAVLPQSYIGASNVSPLIVNNNILFAAARGGHVREMAYNDGAGGYITGDLSLRAPHLFDNKQVVALSYGKAPIPLVWAVSTDGRLLGLTYVPEQQIGAWHVHDTGDGDQFLDVCVIPEGDRDVVYVAVRRQVGGVGQVYIERMASRTFTTLADAVFVDSSLTYRGAPATTITGLGHLEGRTVSILADGGVHPQLVVTGGQITLDEPASVVTVGLPIEADAQTLPMVLEGMSAFGQGRAKNLTQVILRVDRSSGVSAGPTFDKLTEYKQRANEPMGTPPDLVTDEIAIRLSPSWQNGGQVCVRQDEPLPLTIVAMALEAAVAG